MAAMTATMIHVESMQTAVPMRITGAGRTLPIAVSGRAPPLTAVSLQRRFRAVLYYRGAGGVEQLVEEERAAWVKESLSAALADHPEMAGRLRRRDDDEDDGGRRPWEVRLNDNGVRLVQATVDMPMAAFLEAKDLAGREAALALWTDVDVHEPEFCAPFFMQLTRFQDGGYAIGASCSLLLADPLSLVDFLKAWARTHAEMRARSKPVAPPAVIQYARYLQSPGAVVRRLKSVPLDTCSAAAATATATTTVLFRAAAAAGAQVDRHALAAACVDQAVENLSMRSSNAKKPPRLTVLAAGGSGDLSVQACDGDGETTMTAPPSRGHGLRAAYWGDFGLGEIALEGSEPVHVSCTVVSPCADEGLVVVMAPTGGAELLISVTVPN